MKQNRCKPPAVRSALPLDAPADIRTAATLQAMAALAVDGAHSLQMQALAAGVQYFHRPACSPLQAAAVVFRLLSGATRFEPDPPGAELVRSPRAMLDAIAADEVAAGDCDDRATLGAALLLALGVPAMLVVVGRRDDGPFEHVLCAVGHAPADPGTIFIDPQETRTLGQLPAGVRRMAWLNVGESGGEHAR